MDSRVTEFGLLNSYDFNRRNMRHHERGVIKLLKPLKNLNLDDSAQQIRDHRTIMQLTDFRFTIVSNASPGTVAVLSTKVIQQAPLSENAISARDANSKRDATGGDENQQRRASAPARSH